jgi:ribosome-binding factor A
VRDDTVQRSRRGTEGRRAARVGRRIQEELSALILKGLKDPRLDFVSITDVEVTDDLQAAKVFFCTFGAGGAPGAPAEERAAGAAKGFKSALGFIRRELLHRLDLRKLPELTFHYDRSFDYGDKIDRLLKEAHAHDGSAKDGPAGPGEEDAPGEGRGGAGGGEG